MNYPISEITDNSDIQKLLEILGQDLNKIETVRFINSVIDKAQSCPEIAEINIYVGDFEKDIIDKKQLLEEILDIAQKTKKRGSNPRFE